MKDTPLSIYFDPIYDNDSLDAPPAHLPTLMNAGARGVKVGGLLSRLPELSSRWPGRTIVHRDLGRLEQIMEGHGPNAQSPKDAAAWWCGRFKEFVPAPLRALKNVRWGGAYNEWGNWNKLEWYAEFEAERIRLMAADGLKTVTGFFSAEARLWEPVPGTTKTKLERFMPALVAAAEYDAWFDHHCYNSPRLYDPGTTGNDVNDFIFPYRAIWEWLRWNAPSAVYHYIREHTMVGELGADAIQYPSPDPTRLSKPFKGWQQCPGYTRQAYTEDLFSVAQQMWLDGILLATVYVDHRMYDDNEYNTSYGKPGAPRRISAYCVGDLRAARRKFARPGAKSRPRPRTGPGTRDAHC